MTSPRVVLTGGPCAGKTTIAQVLERAFAEQLVILPESASMLFKGGFPRWSEETALKSLQRAIFHVQNEIETLYAAHFPGKMLVMDRGTIDGAAYWPEGAESYFKEVGTTFEAELKRYDTVIYLESAGQQAYETNRRRNPARTETWEEARKLDELTHSMWARHPKMFVIHNNVSFSEKISAVLKHVEGFF